MDRLIRVAGVSDLGKKFNHRGKVIETIEIDD